MSRKKTKFRWFPLHLSTWIVGMIVISALVGLNIRAYTNSPITRVEGDQYIEKNFEYGWPVPSSVETKYYVDGRVKGGSAEDDGWVALFTNSMMSALILLFSVGGLESWTRRREWERRRRERTAKAAQFSESRTED